MGADREQPDYLLACGSESGHSPRPNQERFRETESECGFLNIQFCGRCNPESLVQEVEQKVTLGVEPKGLDSNSHCAAH